MADTPQLRITIMLIDDDEDDRKIFSEALHDVDPSVNLLTAEGGMEAFLQLEEDPQHLPNFIFLDLNMPKMDGHTVLTELKNDELLRNIPVIIYTTSEKSDKDGETIKHEAVSWITKPNSLDDLRKIISEMLNMYKAR